jgi:hypothetical protein
MSDITNWVRLFAVVVFLLIVLPALFAPSRRPRPTDATQQQRKREARESQGFEDGPPATPPHSPTVTTETHAEWIGAPWETVWITETTNRQDDAPGTDYTPQGDGNTGGPAGIF